MNWLSTDTNTVAPIECDILRTFCTVPAMLTLNGFGPTSQPLRLDYCATGGNFCKFTPRPGGRTLMISMRFPSQQPLPEVPMPPQVKSNLQKFPPVAQYRSQGRIGRKRLRKQKQARQGDGLAASSASTSASMYPIGPASHRGRKTVSQSLVALPATRLQQRLPQG